MVFRTCYDFTYFTCGGLLKGNLSVLIKYCGKPDMLDTRSLQNIK